MKVTVISMKMPKVRGRHVAVGDVIDLDRKYFRVFMAAGWVMPYEPPAPHIPASPSVPVTLASANVVDDPPDAESKPEKPEINRRGRGYARRDMKAE